LKLAGCDLAKVLERPSLPARVLVGWRQSGKSTLLARQLPTAAWLSLDDWHIRQRAQHDPALLLESAGLSEGRPIVLDEAAQAPNLFPEVKRRIDEARRHGAREPEIWIAGSNRALLDRNVQESLAGRASYFFLHSLSVAELGAAARIGDWFFRGGFPELYARPELDVASYFADYLRTFVDKDVAAAGGVENSDAFHRVLALLAARSGMLLNATDIGQLAGVKGQTVSAWLQLLQRNALAVLLPPYPANLSKRVVRTPKVYFLDAGFAAHLQGWRSQDPILVSPQAGPLFETLVFGELVRARDHRGLPLTLHFWRTRDGEEVDFLVELHAPSGPRWLAIEAKLAVQNIAPIAMPAALRSELPQLSELWVVTPSGSEGRLSKTCLMVPIHALADRIERVMGGN
jgi:predicted AAA+ superfamily ATPase